jgi:hemolysin III
MDKIHLYSEYEEKLNTISHLTGAVLAFVGIILMLVKVINSPFNIIFATSVFTVLTFSVYLFSTIYHATKDIEKKIFWQKIDHTMVSLIILGTATPILMIISSGTFATVMLVLVVIVTIVNVILNLINVKKFKRYSLVLYFLGVCFLVLGLAVGVKIIRTGFILLMLSSLVVLVFGSCCYMMKSREYTHFIWHITDILCSALHFLAIYLFII